jgi:hypothetical protein
MQITLSAIVLALMGLIFCLSAQAQFLDFNYTTSNGKINITKYTGSGGAVSIPSSINGLPVTAIGSQAFSGCTNLTSVIIPDSIAAIGKQGFIGCTSLTSVTIPNSVTDIGVEVFYTCTSLTNFAFPNTVTSIGYGTFYGCSSLASVTIPNTVTNIGYSAFSDCASLTIVTIPESVTTIGDYVFYHCVNLTGVYFQGNAPSVGTRDVFLSANKAKVYYVEGTKGWGSTFGGLPTVLLLIPPRTATATSQVVNGFVVAFTIMDGGAGYTNAPAVAISGGGGSGAIAFATVLNGSVDKVIVQNAGNGYTGTPIVVIAPPPSLNPPFSDGLVAYYPFNSNANDESGNGSKGTVNGATLTSDRFGRTNSAYYFEGKAQYIAAPLSSTVFANDFTASVWFNAYDIATAWPTILYEQNQSFLVGIVGKISGATGVGNLFCFSSYAAATASWYFPQGLPQSPIGSYCQVVVTKAGQNVKFYLNSQIVGTATFVNPTTVSGSTLYIGRQETEEAPGIQSFHGAIDDVRIYNRALSDQEVKSLYSFESPVLPTNTPPTLTVASTATLPEMQAWTLQATATDADIPAQKLVFSLEAAPAGMTIDSATGLIQWTPTEAQGPRNYTVIVKVTDDGQPSQTSQQAVQITVNEVNAVPFSDGLVAYYPFNGNANDESGNGNNGAIVNVTPSTNRFGENGKALHFTPDQSSAFTVSGSFIPSGYTPITVSLWLQIENPTLPPVGFTKYPIFGGTLDQLNMWNFNLVFQANGIDFTPNIERFDNSGFSGAYALWSLFPNYATALQWHQITISFRNETEVTLYLDGQLVAWGNQPTPVTSFRNAGIFSIGSCPNSASFSGIIDDVRIYNRALSDYEVQILYLYESIKQRNADSDGDNYTDEDEVAEGYDPNDPSSNPEANSVANSVLQFSGVQGQDNWYYGYRNYTKDGGGESYHPETGFIAFNPEAQWSGSQWDLDKTARNPWTEMGVENTHPNSDTAANPDGFNTGVHWTIRRWVANQITKVTPMALSWHVHKANTGGGNGVTGALYINGHRKDAVIVIGTDGTGVSHTYYANVVPGDKIDVILSPRGTDGIDSDGNDASVTRLLVNTTILSMAVQPDGSIFIPVGAGDSDGDGLPDAWENIYFPNDLSKLSGTGDYEKDGLTDLGEYQRGSDPTNVTRDTSLWQRA